MADAAETPAGNPKSHRRRMRKRMSLEAKTLKLCSCNGTIPLDAKRLADALKTGAAGYRPHGAVPQAGGRLPVGARRTRRARRLHPGSAALRRAAEAEGERDPFVNIRETAGWSEQARAPRRRWRRCSRWPICRSPSRWAVEFESAGQLLIVGPGGRALDWAERLAGQLDVTCCSRARRRAAAERRYPMWSGGVSGFRASSALSRSSGNRRTRSTSRSARAAARA